MDLNRPEVYYSNGSFFVFNPEDALRLRLDRIVCQPLGMVDGPHCVNRFAVNIIALKNIACFRKLTERKETSLDENKARFAVRFEELIKSEKQLFTSQRTEELTKRGIPVTSSSMKEFDSTKLRLHIPNLPNCDSHWSPFQTVTMQTSEILSLIDTTDQRFAVFRDLYEKGFYVSLGTKFGCDFLLYFGDPVRYHARYAVRVVASQQDSLVDLSKLNYNEINSFQRLTHTAKKIPIFVTVSNERDCSQISYWTLYERQYLTPECENTIFKSIELFPTSCNKVRKTS